MDTSLWQSARMLVAEHGIDLGGSANADPVDTHALDYAAYCDLTLERPSGGALSQAEIAAAVDYLVRRLQGQARPEHPLSAGDPRIANLSEAYFTPEELARLKCWWDIEPDNAMGLTAVSDAAFAEGSARLRQADGWLARAAPDLHGETHAIVRDIVLARPDGTQMLEFGGASSFALWGAVTINVETHDCWPRYYRTLVHEAAHNLLFGLAREEPLVEDGPNARYLSPLRGQPRPTDGIYHAAFVSARECLAFDSLLCLHEDGDCLDPIDAAMLEYLVERSVIAFWDCIEVLRGPAVLTRLGDAILAECETYMKANFALVDC